MQAIARARVRQRQRTCAIRDVYSPEKFTNEMITRWRLRQDTSFRDKIPHVECAGDDIPFCAKGASKKSCSTPSNALHESMNPRL